MFPSPTNGEYIRVIRHYHYLTHQFFAPRLLISTSDLIQISFEARCLDIRMASFEPVDSVKTAESVLPMAPAPTLRRRDLYQRHIQVVEKSLDQSQELNRQQAPIINQMVSCSSATMALH